MEEITACMSCYMIGNVRWCCGLFAKKLMLDRDSINILDNSLGSFVKLVFEFSPVTS